MDRLPYPDVPPRLPLPPYRPLRGRLGARDAIESDYRRAQMTHGSVYRPGAAQPEVARPPRLSLTDILLQAADDWRHTGQAVDRQVDRYIPPNMRPLVAGALSFLAPDVPGSLEDVAYALEGDPYARHRVAEGLAWMLAFAPLNFVGTGNIARMTR